MTSYGARFRRAFAIQTIAGFYGYRSVDIRTTLLNVAKPETILYLSFPYATLSSCSSLTFFKVVSVNDPPIIGGNRVHTRARLLKSQSKLFRMYGAAWKIKMVMGTAIGMKTDKIKGSCVTSVRAKRKLSDGLNDSTLSIANIKAGEEMDLIDDDPQEYIYPNAEEHGQCNPTEDCVPSL